jgi:hypothetical protein
MGPCMHACRQFVADNLLVAIWFVVFVLLVVPGACEQGHGPATGLTSRTVPLGCSMLNPIPVI